MDNRGEVGAFLTSRRARIKPALRRAEVAALAGVSAEFYAGLERGELAGASESVLNAVAGALRLDGTDTAHLHHLARAAGQAWAPRRDSAWEVRPSIRRVLGSMTGASAYLRNHRFDVLAANVLGQALYAPMFAGSARPLNSVRFLFLDPTAQAFFADWHPVARAAVGALRDAAARHADDHQLMNLVGELSMRSEDFRAWWAAHDGAGYRPATTRLRHPVVGELELDHESLELPGEDLTIETNTAEAGTVCGDGLALLATWAASNGHVAIRFGPRG